MSSCHIVFSKAGFILRSIRTSPLNLTESKSNWSMLIRGQYIKMFLMISIYFLSIPEYLIGSPTKLEKEMATNSSVLAWRIPGTGEPVGLPSMGSHRVGHNWSDLAAAAPQRKQKYKAWYPAGISEVHSERLITVTGHSLNKFFLLISLQGSVFLGFFFQASNLTPNFSSMIGFLKD